MTETIVLGSRASRLARAQTDWVCRALKKKWPKLRFRIITLKTEGDKRLDQPLWQMEGKDFWVKELDQALLSKKIDVTVHSLKDLSLTRPSGIQLAAIPPRDDPRDCLVLRVPGKNSPKVWKIGTSSPRRKILLESVWKKYFAATFGACEAVVLRGNVPTRLKKIGTGPDQIDGACLAFAGLLRLLEADPAARTEVASLLTQKSLLVLPPWWLPGAPGQGALAIECREDDSVTKKRLLALHHEDTAADVKEEREQLRLAGGGCHTPIATAVIGGVRYTNSLSDPVTISVTRVRSATDKTPPPPGPTLFVGAFDSLPNDALSVDPLRFHSLPWESAYARMRSPHVLVFASPTAVQFLLPTLEDFLRQATLANQVRLAAVGEGTHRTLSAFGLPVHFTGLHSGWDSLRDLFVRLRPTLPGWKLVYATSDTAPLKQLPKGWRGTQLPVYSSRPNAVDPNLINSLEQMNSLVFSSWSNFEAFLETLSAQGKTPRKSWIKRLSTRTWVRQGPSLRKVRSLIPEARAWSEAMLKEPSLL